MSKLNEKKIIELFQKKLGNTNFISEDVEFFKIGKKYLIAKVDTLVESTDVPPGMKLEDVARKSVVSCVSDFAAKGVKPIFGIISLTIPKRFSKLNIERLANGFQKATKEFQLKILGGDTNEGKELVINFSLFGVSEKIVTRKGAKTNHVIRFKAKAQRAVFRPNCRLMFGLKNKNYFSSSMDSSDGLSSTLNEMSNQSKKKFVITRMPSENDVFNFSNSNKLNPNDLIFNAGEEYEIVSTVSMSNLPRIKKYAKKHQIKIYEIGYVAEGRGVFYNKNGKLVRIKDDGWQHLQKS